MRKFTVRPKTRVCGASDLITKQQVKDLLEGWYGNFKVETPDDDKWFIAATDSGDIDVIDIDMFVDWLRKNYPDDIKEGLEEALDNKSEDGYPIDLWSATTLADFYQDHGMRVPRWCLNWNNDEWL